MKIVYIVRTEQKNSSGFSDKKEILFDDDTNSLISDIDQKDNEIETLDYWNDEYLEEIYIPYCNHFRITLIKHYFPDELLPKLLELEKLSNKLEPNDDDDEYCVDFDKYPNVVNDIEKLSIEQKTILIAVDYKIIFSDF